MLCQDASLKYLQGFGYCAMRLPRADAGPLEVLVRSNGELTRLGHITDVFTNPDCALPGIHIGLPEADSGLQISGMESAKIDVSLGLNILGAVIGALGGNLGVKVQYSLSLAIAFTYLDVAEQYVDIAPLDAFLGGAVVRDNLRTISQMLEADEVYIFTKVLKTLCFGVEAFDQQGVSLGLEVPVIQEAVGAQLKISADAARQTRTIYKGGLPLTFAFQAVQLIYENGRYQVLHIVKPGSVTARSPAHDPAAKAEPIPALLQSAAGLSRIKES